MFFLKLVSSLLLSRPFVSLIPYGTKQNIDTDSPSQRKRRKGKNAFSTAKSVEL